VFGVNLLYEAIFFMAGIIRFVLFILIDEGYKFVGSN
jgi:hypothetical protein